MSELYDTDVLEWSEHQAQLLRRLAQGHAGNEAPDWANIIEEIESVGRSEFKSLKSLLMQTLLHDLRCAAWPQSSYVRHWAIEARAFRLHASDVYTPSMRRRVDLNELYRRALSLMPADVDGYPPLPMPDTCPVTLDQLLGLP